MRWLLIVAGLLLSFVAAADVPVDKQRLMNEACGFIAQQRNSVADQIAVAEAQRKLLQERLDQWEAYFRAYLGEPR